MIVIIRMQFKFILFWTLLLTLTVNQSNSEAQVPIKPVMQAIPPIDNTYSVVHMQIYPKATDDKFKATLPPDYFVKKAQQNKDKKLINTAGDQKQEILNPSKSTSANDIQANSLNQQEKPLKRGPISTSILAENNKQTIAWVAPKLQNLTPFVVENGVQHKIVQAVPQNPPVIQYLQEGKSPSQTLKRPQPLSLQKQKISKQQNKPAQIQVQNKVQPQTQVQKQPQGAPKTTTNPQPATNLIQSNNTSSTPTERFEKHRQNLIWIVLGTIILIVVFVAIRSQRQSKISSLSILHSRLESYKIQQQDEDQDKIVKNNSSSLQDDQDSDEQYEPSKIYRNSNKL